MRNKIILIFLIVLLFDMNIIFAQTKKDETKPALAASSNADMPMQTVQPIAPGSPFDNSADFIPEYWHLRMQDPSIDKLILKEAKIENIEKDPEVQKKIEHATSSVLIAEVIKKKFSDVPKISDEDLKRYYEEHKEDYFVPESIEGMLIIVADEATAEDILKRLKKGEDFSKLAREKSVDLFTKELGGRLGRYLKNDSRYSDNFKNAVFKLKEGELNSIKTDEGFYVARVDKRYPAKYEDFDTIKFMLRVQVESGIKEKILRDWIESLKSKEEKSGQIYR